MSWNICLEINTGGSESVDVYDEDLTYNVGMIIRFAFDQHHETNALGSVLDGKTATEAASMIGDALNRLRDPANGEKLAEMEPRNGWGSLRSTITFLKSLRAACLEHPKCTICVS